MGQVDIERAREALKIAVVVRETSSEKVRVLFLDRNKFTRAKIFLSGAGLIEDRNDDEAFHKESGLYQLNILRDRAEDFMALLPAQDPSPWERLEETDHGRLTAETAAMPIPPQGRTLMITCPVFADEDRLQIAQLLSVMEKLYQSTNPDDSRARKGLF